MNKNITLIIILILVLLLCSFGGIVSAETETVSMQLENVPLLTIINTIALQYDLNVVVSGDVEKEVTVRLNDVSIFTALNSILHPNGFNYYMDGNVIVIKPTDSKTTGELDAQIITLKYCDPVMAQKALDAYKSEKGKVVILDKTKDGDSNRSTYHPNQILISDYPTVLKKMLNLIADLDIPERLISIEVKIIETTIDSKAKLGFDWPTQINANLGAKSVSEPDATSSSQVDFDNSVGIMDLETKDWVWGTLSIDQMNIVLNLLEQNDNSKLISDPRITTVENHEALIQIQTIIPIPTINRFSEAASTTDILTFFDEEVGISLRVTPRINENGMITMDVNPIIEDIIGFAGPADNQKPITTQRSIKTRITVKNGETAALGGLLKENEIIVKRKVPGLSLIPILGNLLFTSHSTEKKTTDLLILITPTIIQ